MSRDHRRSVYNYVLNSAFQLRFTALIVMLATVLTSGLSYFLISKARDVNRVLSTRALDATDELAQQLTTQFERNDRTLIVVLAVFGIVLAVVLAVYGIMLTHRVAGPLFKVAGHFDRIRDGKLGEVHDLRKGDYLVDFFAHFKGAHDALRASTEADIALLSRAIEALAKQPVVEELRAAKLKKEDSLK
jgi:hypothetical protein